MESPTATSSPRKHIHFSLKSIQTPLLEHTKSPMSHRRTPRLCIPIPKHRHDRENDLGANARLAERHPGQLSSFISYPVEVKPKTKSVQMMLPAPIPETPGNVHNCPNCYKDVRLQKRSQTEKTQASNFESSGKVSVHNLKSLNMQVEETNKLDPFRSRQPSLEEFNSPLTRQNGICDEDGVCEAAKICSNAKKLTPDQTIDEFEPEKKIPILFSDGLIAASSCPFEKFCAESHALSTFETQHIHNKKETQLCDLNSTFWEDIPLLLEPAPNFGNDKPSDVMLCGSPEKTNLRVNIPLICNVDFRHSFPPVRSDWESSNNNAVMNDLSLYDNVTVSSYLVDPNVPEQSLVEQTMPSSVRDRQPAEPIGILRAESSRSSGRSVGFLEDSRHSQARGFRSDSTTVNGSSWPAFSRDPTAFSSLPMERPASISSSAKQPKSDEENDEEDYSASASAIISRVSVGGRRRAANRRASSHSPEFGLPSCNRRRSSVFTTSSAETGVSAEEGTGTGMGAEAGVGAETSQEQMYENMRLHKEVLNGVRLQPWPMRRKLWLVKQAKLFLSKHEGQLQERLAQSKRTKDLLARFNIFFTKQWQNSKRELANLMNILIPWELRIKEIESHFGSAVASYFTFLRWLFWVNLVISILLIAFVAVPEVVLVNHRNTDTSERKTMLPEEEANSTSFETLWNFEGVLKYSPLFYGYYSNRDEDTQQGYRLPMAYFLTGIGVYVYSFIATLRRMAVNSRQSKLSEKEDECVFTWKLFTGWDYMIGNAETAHNRTSSIILSFKEALLEEAEKKREDLSWKIIFNRIFVNLVVTVLLVCSATAVVFVVERSTSPDKNSSWWRQNEINIVINFIGSAFPHMFELLGALERYHPRKSLRIHLARIMALNLLNIYTFMFAVFNEISNMTHTLGQMKENLTSRTGLLSTSPPPQFAGLQSEGGFFTEVETEISPWEVPRAMSLIAACHRIPINCSLIGRTAGLVVGVSSVLTANLSDHLNLTDPLNLTDHLNFTDQLNLTDPSNLTDHFNFTDHFNLTNELNITDYLNLTDLSNTESPNLNLPGNILDSSFLATFETDLNLVRYYTELHNVSGEVTLNFSDPEAVLSPQWNATDLTLLGLSEEEENRTTMEMDTSTRETPLVLNETICYVTVCDRPTAAPIENGTAENTTGEEEYRVNVSTVEPPKVTQVSFTTQVSKTTDIVSDNNITKSTREESNTSAISSFGANLSEYAETSSSKPPMSSTQPSTVASQRLNGSTTVECIPRPFANIPVPTSSLQNVTQNSSSPAIKHETTDNSSTEYVFSTASATPLSNTEASIHTDWPNKSGLTSAGGSSEAVFKTGDCTREPPQETPSTTKLDIETRRKLRRLCWETMFGQEIVKLTVGDLVMTILSTVIIDFLRALFVRFMNRCWCWDLEKKFPQYGDFKIAENILHLVNNQGMVWMGIFFSPGLPLINVIKLIIIMYLRAWAVLTCNVPHEIVFRASRSNNFFFALLLLMLFLCVLPVGYAIVWVEPSWHCGPFSGHKRIYYIFTNTLRKIVPRKLHRVMDYVASPGIVIPLLMLLILVIYYLLSLTSALREANNDLKTQLRRERTEERRKMFQIADRRRRGIDDYVDSTLVKWKQILPEVQANSEKNGDKDNDSNPSSPTKAAKVKGTLQLKRKDTMADIVQQVMTKTDGLPVQERKGGADEHADGTDVECQDSLSEDAEKKSNKKERKKPENALQNSAHGQAGKKKKSKSKKSRGEKEKKQEKNSRQKTDLGEENSLCGSVSSIPKIQISESSTPDSKKMSEASGSAETVVTTKFPGSSESGEPSPENSGRNTPEEVSDPVPATVSIENEADAENGRKSLKFGLFRKHKTTPMNCEPAEETWSSKRNKMTESRTLSLSQAWRKKGRDAVKISAASESDLTIRDP